MKPEELENNTNPLASVPQAIIINKKGYALRNFDSIVQLRMAKEFGSMKQWQEEWNKVDKEVIIKTLFCFLHDIPMDEIFQRDFKKFRDECKNLDIAVIVKTLNEIFSISVPAEKVNIEKKKDWILGSIILGLAIYGFTNLLFLLITQGSVWINTTLLPLFRGKGLI